MIYSVFQKSESDTDIDESVELRITEEGDEVMDKVIERVIEYSGLNAEAVPISENIDNNS